MVDFHLIVLLDCSGSMGESFSLPPKSSHQPRGEIASHNIKIDEAKAQLISWFETSDCDKATIIPFSSTVKQSLQVVLPQELDSVKHFMDTIDAGGGTNLAAALEIGLSAAKEEEEEEEEEEDSKTHIRYLIITDGLSNTQDRDIELVSELPKSQGIDCLVINPTEEGINHLNRIRVYGKLHFVYGPADLRRSLKEQQSFNKNRKSFGQQYEIAYSDTQEVYSQLQKLVRTSVEEKAFNNQTYQKANDVLKTLSHSTEKHSAFREKLANPEISDSELDSEISAIKDNLKQAKELIAALQLKGSSTFSSSLAYPQKLSKGYSSTFLFQVYLSVHRSVTEQHINSVFKEVDNEEIISDSLLRTDMLVEIAISSPDIDFHQPISTLITSSGTKVSFWAKPKDTCIPGKHSGVLTIRDPDSHQQYESIPFSMTVVDYAFDHISRPLLGNFVSFFIGCGSVITFCLALLGQIDKTFGMTSGTAGGAVAGFIYSRVLYDYKKHSVKIPQSGAQVP